MLSLCFAATILHDQAPPAELASMRIVCVRRDDERPNLYSMKGDGSGLQLLAKDGMLPTWSPDHKQIAFVRLRGVWVMNADGSNQKSVYAAPGEDAKVEGLSWGRTPGASTGDSIMFGVYNQNQTDVYRVDRASDGSFSAARLESAVQQWFGMSERAFPAVSSTGKSIAYTGNGDIWMSILDDERWRTGRVAAVAQYDLTPQAASNATVVARKISWVPNARKLVFEFSRMWGSGLEEIWLLDFSKARDPLLDVAQVKLRKLAENAIEPSVSPDGNWVIATKVVDWEGAVAISLKTGKSYRVKEGVESPSW